MNSSFKKIIIADAGGTKVRWILFDRILRKVTDTIITPGINAINTPKEAIESSISQANSILKYADSIYYYGAGCVSQNSKQTIYHILAKFAHGRPNIEINSDMLGAARGLLQHKKGIAAILGTGSNSCLYDGCVIITNVHPMGFILGDEGSGTHLGKRLLSDTFRRILPLNICNDVINKYDLTYPSVIEHIYRSPNASKYLASFAPYISANIDIPEIHDIAYQCLRDFFIRNISLYDDCHSLPIAFTGSVANALKSTLLEVADNLNYKVDLITTDPIEGLINYHASKFI